MIQISVREFNLHPTKYLKTLPLILTQYNKPIAKVIPFSNSSADTFPEKIVDTANPLFRPIRRMPRRTDSRSDNKTTVNGVSDEPLSVINVDLDKINFPDASQITDPGFGMAKLRPLPEDGTILAMSPTGKCEVSQMNCKKIGKGYRVTFMTDEGEKKKDVFLCDVHFKKAKDSDMEIMEL